MLGTDAKTVSHLEEGCEKIFTRYVDLNIAQLLKCFFSFTISCFMIRKVMFLEGAVVGM